MSNEHLPPRTLREYRRGRLSPAENLAVSDHLAACAVCRGQLTGLDDGPRYEELAAAVDGTPGPAERAILNGRLAEAPGAAEELADLEEFHREMAARGGETYGPLAEEKPKPTTPGTILRPPPATWWRRHEALVQTVTSIAAVLVLTTLWWRLSGSKPALEDVLLADERGRQADLAVLPADLREAVTRTLRDGRAPVVAPPAELRPRGSGLAGPVTASSFVAISPVGVLVRDLRPTLRWTPRPDATGYVVSLEPLGENVPVPPASPELPATQTEWTPPGPLTAGAVYTWQVEAWRGTETLDRAPRSPAAAARFRVLDESHRAELERVEREFAGFPLVRAVALARAGLLEEAADQLGKLAEKHPQSAAAQRLWRGASTSAAARLGRGWEQR